RVHSHHRPYDTGRGLADKSQGRQPRGRFGSIDDQACSVLQHVRGGKHEIPSEKMPAACRGAGQGKCVAAQGSFEESRAVSPVRKKLSRVDMGKQVVEPEVEGKEALAPYNGPGVYRPASLHNAVDLLDVGRRNVRKHD